MYETLTYDKILNQMLDRVQNDVDKREGSILWDALAPAAAELAQMYIELEIVLQETFAEDASRYYLEKRAAERGIRPEPATKAILKGEFNIAIPLGSRFNLEELNYVAIERIAEGVYRMQCETPGRVGNHHMGTLIPMEYTKGLERAELTEILIPGEDEEDTERFRKRYFNSLDSKAYGGNIQDYKEKVNTLSGVGGVKVYPVWKGGGTVKLAILNSEHEVPSKELIDTVQELMDPVPNQGRGLGVAPIGHVVTVEGVTETRLDVGTQITYRTGWTWADVKGYVEKALDDYFIELAMAWADSEALIVRISQIETRLLTIAGILDITHTTINGKEENAILEDNAIPKRGEVVG